MPRKSNKRSNKGKRTRKQKPIVMVGCSKKGKKSCRNSKVFSSLKSLSNKSCPNCGPNCHCGPNCKCPHPCPGNCYLNRRMKKQKGGQGCGSCGCPIGGLSYKQMNQFGGYSGTYPANLIPHVNGEPVIISPPQKGYQPILGIGQNGGNCGTGSCGQTPVVPRQTGGNYFKQIGAMPGPNVGKPWGPDLKWPGMNDVGGDRNYFKPYNTNNDPQQQMLTSDAAAGYLNKNSMVGGYTYSKKSSSSSASSKRGGGLIPQDLVNLGRDFNYNFKTAYNALNGYKAPVDPAPYKGQLTGALNNNRFMV
jgi:hypothetical protein